VAVRAMDQPAISVVVSTRNRAQEIGGAVKSILACDYPCFELVVVDQSDHRDTEEALEPFMGDPRLRLITSSRAGLSYGRNLGSRETSAELIAFTDDDCEVSSDWLRAIAAAFCRDKRIGVVFGSVATSKYDRRAGFVIAYQAPPFHIERGLRKKACVEGIGACMAMRRSVWNELGGFDEALGVGGPFCAGEDTDITARALLAGWSIAETPDAVVTHYGFRTWEMSRSVIRGYMFGLGSVHAKMLRLGGFSAMAPLVQLGWRWLAQRPVADLNQTPPRGERLWGFLDGLRAGLLTPIAKGVFDPEGVVSGYKIVHHVTR
jgi:GT2 family glycosyltransferase